MNINSESLDKLIGEIEKIRRRKIVDFKLEDNIQYFDPFNNLEKIKTSNNHLVVGRRGSGKTTLLLTTIKQDDQNFICPIDSQIFRIYKAPEIIIQILERLINQIHEKLKNTTDFNNSKEVYKRNYAGLWNGVKRIFFKDDKLYKYEEYKMLITSLDNLIIYINSLKHYPDEPFNIYTKSQTIQNSKTSKSSKLDSSIKGKLSAKGKLKGYYSSLQSEVELATSITEQLNYSEEKKNEFKSSVEFKKTYSKKEELLKIKMDISSIFSDFTRLSKKKIIIYLDDFYLIPLEQQPDVLQYFHDIYKNAEYNSFCFKICSIPNRTRLNKDGKVDFSIKDDFSPIKLDKELYDLHNLKDFLLRISSNLQPDLKLSAKDIFDLFNNEEVLEYTIVATGGVPRDFLVTLAELIKIARTDSSTSIKKQHLYSAISDSKEDKDQNIEVDSDIDPELLREALKMIENEIIVDLKTNIILYPARLVKEHEFILKNLVNLRYLHIINENTTSEKLKKENFVSYLIDMTFYATGKRLKQGFEFRRFWEKDSSSRHVNLRSAPIWNFDIKKLSEKIGKSK